MNLSPPLLAGMTEGACGFKCASNSHAFDVKDLASLSRYGIKGHVQDCRCDDCVAMKPLFTIGHSAHSIEVLLQLLAHNQIDAVADVRSFPYSRNFPCFSKPSLEVSLKSAGIHYVFLGRELGARRDECECYLGHAVSFDRVAVTAAFTAGLTRLQEGLAKYRIALLCAEKEPLDCHRTILVARHAARFAKISHILADGRVEPHEETENRLLMRYGWSEGDMFRSHENRLAEAYSRRGREIAWVESSAGDNLS